MKKSKIVGNKFVATAVTSAIVAAMFLATSFTTSVYADGEKTIEGLGTAGISAPKAPETKDTPWTGSYVYYGNYFGETKYRVLDPHTTLYGGDTMLLDCDRVLYQATGSLGEKTPWDKTTMAKTLNGDNFLTSDQYFTDAERNAIFESTISSHKYVTSNDEVNDRYGSSFGFEKMKIFVLNVDDVMNPKYGYTSDPGAIYGKNKEVTGAANRVKYLKNKPSDWALASELSKLSNCFAAVGKKGDVTTWYKFLIEGASPAMNIDLNSILFTSKVPNTTNEYTLTIKDDDLKIAIPQGKSVSKTGYTVSVPFAISGADYKADETIVSVLILDKEYKDGNTNDAKVLYYKVLSLDDIKDGVATFEIPQATPYDYTYILAENITDAKFTDYASAPLKLDIPAHNHRFEYEAVGCFIVATCYEPYCTLPLNVCDQGNVMLTLAEPKILTDENCTTAAAYISPDEIAAFNAATGKNVSVDDIVYVGRDGTDYAETTTSPTKAGKYTAKLTVEGFTAVKDYEITKDIEIKKEDPVTPSDPKSQILEFVNRIYTFVLDREPEAEGAAFWSDELYAFRRTGAEVAQGFIFSAEFESRNTTDEQFVTILYKTFFGRDPEAEGMAFWLGQLSSGTMDRVAVANGFIFSQEWANKCAEYGIRSGGDIKPTGVIQPTELTYAFVERMYTTAMGRSYDEEGRQYWASALANFEITGEQCGASFFLSDEMINYNLSDKDFLGRLYATFMNREAD